MSAQRSPEPIEYLTPREAADRYHVNPMTLRRRIRSGDLPAVRCGTRLIRVPVRALEELFTPVPNSTWWGA